MNGWVFVVGQVCNDLLGGSSGAMGGQVVHETLAFNGSAHQGYGGAGGGVIELIAVNDLIIGRSGGVLVEGEAGGDSFRGGTPGCCKPIRSFVRCWITRYCYPVIAQVVVAVEVLSSCPRVASSS